MLYISSTPPTPQHRCDRAEQQLLSVRDLEGDDSQFYDDDGFGSSSENLSSSIGPGVEGGSHDVSHGYPLSSKGQGLQRRGGSGGSSLSAGGLSRRRARDDHKVISDLEKIGVRAGPGVTRAVDMIDTWTLVTGRYVEYFFVFTVVLRRTSTVYIKICVSPFVSVPNMMVLNISHATDICYFSNRGLCHHFH